jgi:hypothetical protein
MSGSLIEQLQLDSIDRNVRTSDLLRKALLVASKLDIPGVPQWIENELSGYTGNNEVPAYRRIQGRIMAKTYSGWVPVLHSGRIVVRSDRPSSIVAPNRNITKVEWNRRRRRRRHRSRRSIGAALTSAGAIVARNQAKKKSATSASRRRERVALLKT